MRTDIHPNARPVIFKDTSTGDRYLAYSTVASSTTETYDDGKEYPVCFIEISSASHPFFTGKQQLVDTAGRVERFKRRYNIKD